MRQDTWDRLDEIFADAPMMKAEGVSYQELSEIADEENFVLPGDYHEFMHRYGGATVGPYSILGLRAADTMGSDEASAFELTKRFRAEGWTGTENWLVFSVDLGGNPVGIDEKGVIWISDHENGCVDKVADDFEGYLRHICLGLNS